jgi:hypothetical protein
LFERDIQSTFSFWTFSMVMKSILVFLVLFGVMWNGWLKAEVTRTLLLFVYEQSRTWKW